MKNKLHIVLLLILLLGIFWQWWLLGPRVAIDFPIVSGQHLKTQMDLPRIWAQKDVEGMGEYSVFTLWSYPFTVISGLLAKLGLGFALQERILWVIPFLIIGILSIWKISRELDLSNYAKFIAALFYLTNTYILLVVDGGQLSIALGYAFLPLSFLAIKNAITKDLKEGILAGLSIWLLGIFDIRLIYILFLLCLIYFLYFLFLRREGRFAWMLGWIKTGVICSVMWIGLNAYWLFPQISDPISSITYRKLTQTDSQSLINLGHAILLLAPHWYKNIFGNITQLKLEFFIIPILIFLAPVLKPKDKLVGFWIAVALIGIFLAKGASEPFSDVYKWLFFNIPGFSLFRDSSKFFFLIALSYSVLLGITFDATGKRIKAFKIKYLFFLFTIFYLIFLIRPILLEEMTGTFSKPPLEKEYSKLTTIFENDKDFARIFWIPSKAPLGYFSQVHPSLEGLRLTQKRPFAVSAKGTYEILNYLREAPYMGEIFDVAGIGYIAYPLLDPRRDNLHPDNIKYYYTFSEQLSKLSWLSKMENSPIPLWKTKQHQDKFFVTDNVWLVVGSDSIYDNITTSTKLRLSKNALIFIEEYVGLGNVIDELPEARIVLNDKTHTDLAVGFIKSNQLIFPSKQLQFDPDQSGWWKREAADLIKWRDFLQTRYGIDNQDFDLGGGWAVGENNLKFKIENLKLEKDQIVLARIMESSRSGKLKFYQDDKLIGEVVTKTYENTNVRWFEVGKLTSDKELLIESSGDINVVNALAVLDKNEWAAYQEKAKKLQVRIVNFDEKNANFSTKPILTYRMINPTKYSIRVENLEEPSFLVFSENYDPNWQMVGQTSLPVYSFLNGFKIEKNGEYEVVFKAQEKVEQGLVISILTLLVSFGLLIYIKNNKKVK